MSTNAPAAKVSKVWNIPNLLTYGRIIAVDGNKLTIDFDKAGEKRVLDSFVSAA